MREEALKALEARRDEALKAEQAMRDEALKAEQARRDEALKAEQAMREALKAEQAMRDEALKALEARHDEALKAQQAMRDEALQALEARHDEALKAQQMRHDEALAAQGERHDGDIASLQHQVDLIWPAARFSYFHLRHEALSSVVTFAHLLCRLANRSYNRRAGTAKFTEHLRFGSFCTDPYKKAAGSDAAGPPPELKDSRVTHIDVGTFVRDSVAHFGVLTADIDEDTQTASLDIVEELRTFITDRNDVTHNAGGFLLRDAERAPDNDVIALIRQRISANAAALDSALAYEGGHEEALVEDVRTLLGNVANTWRALDELAQQIRAKDIPRVPGEEHH